MRREHYVCLAVGVLLAGIASRMIDTDSVLVGKYLGDALYAVLFYLLLAVLWPRHPAAWRVALSIVLGTKFGWYDMLSYLVGIASIGLLDVAIPRSDRVAR